MTEGQVQVAVECDKRKRLREVQWELQREAIKQRAAQRNA